MTRYAPGWRPIEFIVSPAPLTLMALTLTTLMEALHRLAPPQLAESWDNVGLLIDGARPVRRVLTCLTLTSDVAAEALETDADAIVTHHPVLFRGAKALTGDKWESRLLLELIRAGVAVYSPHTAYDNAPHGINQQWAEQLGLTAIRPLRPLPDGSSPECGAGRRGDLPVAMSWPIFLSKVKSLAPDAAIQWTAPREPVQRVGVACGAAADFLDDAIASGCDVFITGEARFHAGVQAREAEIALIVLGHYASERPGVEQLARWLQSQLPGAVVTASTRETDPWRSGFQP